MLRWLKPNLTGVLLLLVVLVPMSIPRSSIRFSPGGAVTSHGDLGYPTWFSWNDTGAWHVHVAAPVSLAAMWCLSMLLGTALQRSRRWKMPRRWPLAFAALPVIAEIGRAHV